MPPEADRVEPHAPVGMAGVADAAAPITGSTILDNAVMWKPMQTCALVTWCSSREGRRRHSLHLTRDFDFFLSAP